MKNTIHLLLITLLLSLLTGCNKDGSTSSINLVESNKRSKSFDAVAAKLDLGGEIYSYMDTEGLVDGITDSVAAFIGEMQGSRSNPIDATGMMVLSQLPALSKHLGLSGIDAIGTSAYYDEDHYHAKS